MHTPRRPSAVSVLQAVESAPTLAHLSQMASQSAIRLALIRPLIPKALQGAVQAGALEEGSWCLLVPNSAAAAKLRQMTPSLLEVLQARGHAVTKLRIKIVTTTGQAGFRR
ncbi:DciA family protein [Ottowia thiooxydans]|uniref:DciA family protein n=1 Tax=Ottowia thiooxydans TaxID=219182 RepID=UPI00048CDD21|nr:DciA family protein [Ottowia thiooxydans]